MSPEDGPSYVVECTTCEMSCTTDDFADASTFDAKHTEHTDHEVEWTTLESPLDDTVLADAWELRCAACAERWSFRTAEEADERRRDHARRTDHDPGDPVETDQPVVGPDLIKETIHVCGAEYDGGLPMDALVEEGRRHGIDRERTVELVDRLLDRGEIMETRVNRYKTVVA
jgi:hypothetical protein